jgi:hypothetical protein
MLRSLNVAFPPIATTVLVPVSVPFPGLREIVTVTLSAKLGTSLFDASRASTTTGAIMAPAVVMVGSTLNDNCDATGGGPDVSAPLHVATEIASNATAPYLRGAKARSHDEKPTSTADSWGTRNRDEECFAESSRIHAR